MLASGRATPAEHAEARRLATGACRRDVLPVALAYLRQEKSRRIQAGGGVMVIVDSESEGIAWAQKLAERKELRPDQMLVINGTQSVNLVAGSKDLPAVCMVFVPCTYPSGFNLTRCDVMVSRIMTNLAASVRAQLEWRINRLGQTANEVTVAYVVDDPGHFDQNLMDHNYVRNLNRIFADSFGRLMS